MMTVQPFLEIQRLTELVALIQMLMVTRMLILAGIPAMVLTHSRPTRLNGLMEMEMAMVIIQQVLLQMIALQKLVIHGRTIHWDVLIWMMMDGQINKIHSLMKSLNGMILTAMAMVITLEESLLMPVQVNGVIQPKEIDLVA